jgi:hypothetical protein
MDIDVEIFSTDGEAGIRKIKSKEARRNENIGKRVTDFFRYSLMFICLIIPWFFIK